MSASKQYNYSGQTAVYDRVIQLSESGIDVKSLISDSKPSKEIAVNNFLDTYDLVADGEKNITSGTTIKAKIINKNTGEEVLGISKPTEFIWYDDENNIIANGIDKYTFDANKFIGKVERKYKILWNHIIEYSIGNTLHEANIEYVVNFTIRILEITEYVWNNCLTEKELEEQGYKNSGLWSNTIKENTENYLYLWVRKSNNNRLTWVYYRSTGETGADGKTRYLHIAYATSADGSEGFSITESANKTYIGQYTDFEVSDSTDYTKYKWTKIKGEQGIQGNDGLDGQNAYTHIAYANSEDGSIDFSTTDFLNKKYIGIYVDFEKEDSEDYTKYKWKKYVADETRIEYCWHNSEENPPEELSASYDSLDIYYDKELVWISVFDTEHSIKAPNENDIHLWIRTSIDNGKNWEYSKFNGNPAKAIKIITNRHYFDRNETNDKGEVGEYLENQIANITLERQNISGNTDVSWFFDGELYKTQSIKQPLIITPSMLNSLGKLYISVVYDNVSYDSIELYTNVIKPTYAGILPSDNTSPVTINGRECVNGDHFIYLDENGSPVARLYINGKWKDLSSTDSQYYSLVMGDILADVINKPSVNSQNGIYQFFSNIAAYGAFIKNLYTENLKINNGLFDLKIGIFNNKLVFDVIYNGNIIFSIDPYTGYIFLGKPNSNKTNPETGFMINPSDENNIISTKNGYFSIDKNGTLKTISMESIDSKFENAKITNGEFSGYFNCYSIKTERESKEIYKQSTLYKSNGYLQCAKFLLDLNMQVYSERINYTEPFSCKFSLSDKVKYCRFQQNSNLGGNYFFQFVALQLFDENRNIIRPNDLGINFIKNPNIQNNFGFDINSIHSAYWRVSGSNNIDMADSKYGLYLLDDCSIELYKGGNRLVVDIPGVEAFVDPSTITEQGRLYVDSNGFVKAKIFY